ncbi:MAG: hypothetical protein QOH25_1639 [Acidobacteriota bacterium]|jgi:hypothetical protein|nr:hypothetical protein [Acidobacteriota bacterium]
MNCQTCRFEIEELKTEERLSDEARAHLSVCPVCRAFHDERQALKRLVGSLEVVAAPADFDFRLRARINAAKNAGNHRSSWRSFLASAPAIGLAASFALIVAAGVFYNQTKPAPSTINQQAAVAGKSSDSKPAQANPDSVQTAEVSETPQPITSGSKQEEDSVIATAGAKNPRSRTNGNSKQSARRESSRPGADIQQLPSNDLAVRPAPQIIPNGASPFNAGTNLVVELPVRSASQPMRVFVDDRSGAKRTVTLEPVIFGSQDFIGRNTSRAQSSQGIW